jgi:hypothetical protein
LGGGDVKSNRSADNGNERKIGEMLPADPEGVEESSPGQRPGDAGDASTEALKGRKNLKELTVLAPFQGFVFWSRSGPQGVALGCILSRRWRGVAGSGTLSM